MTANIGTIDRLLRFVAGLLLIILPFTGAVDALSSAPTLYASVAIGAVLLLTAAIKFCPLYRVLGMRTCRS